MAGVLIAAPSIALSAVLPGISGNVVLEARLAHQTAADAALLSGQRVAEALNYTATAQQTAQLAEAQLIGTIGLAAAASVSGAGGGWARGIVTQTQRIQATVQSTWDYASAARDTGMGDVNAAVQVRGFASVDIQPPVLDLPKLPSADVCKGALKPNALLGLSPTLKVHATAAGIAATMAPFGPAAFEAAFTAAVAKCAGGSLVGGITAPSLPDHVEHVVTVRRDRGNALAHVRVEQTGDASTPNYVVRLVAGIDTESTLDPTEVLTP